MNQSNLEIVELDRQSIDIGQWDKCVKRSANYRIYAQSWYLDAAFPNWRGIVVGKYNYVMPICASKKWGINYLFQPTYCQQHGIFPVPTPEVFKLIFDFILSRYHFVDICLNSMNISYTKEYEFELRPNYILSLNENYSTLKANYSTHCKRHLKKTSKHAISIKEIEPNTFLKFKLEQSKKGLNPGTKKAFQRIINNSKAHNAALFCGAFSSSNALLAAAFFLKTPGRIIYLNGVSSDLGHEEDAMYAIIDDMIRKNSETKTIFDFEGSSIKGIARFFEGFGTQPEHYSRIKINNLPFFLKWIKK